MQHQKLEKRGSWNGFESSRIAHPPKLGAQSPDFRSRCLDNSALGKPTTKIMDMQSYMPFDASKHLAGVQLRAGVIAQGKQGPEDFPMERRNCQLNYSNTTSKISCESKTNPTRASDSEAQQRLLSTDYNVDCDSTGKMTVSSQRLNAMEIQLVELHKQLKELKTTNIDPSGASDNRCKDVEYNEVFRRLQDSDQTKKEMNTKILELENDLSSSRQKSKREILARERLQAELRRLADMIASASIDDDLIQVGELHDASRVNEDNGDKFTESDVSALKAQLQIFKEDFSCERSDNERLRIQNVRLMSELEEAKRVIEEQQKQLLLYAHLHTNDCPSSVILTPMNDSLSDRRSRSVPSTPNSSPHTRYTYSSNDTGYHYDGLSINAEHFKHKQPEVRSLSDVVPRGSHRESSSPIMNGGAISRSLPKFSEVDEIFPRAGK